MKRAIFALLLVLGSPAIAQTLDRITDEAAFLALIDGRSLSNRLYGISLIVTADGNITGDALGWDVTGGWDWQDGFFCREMAWGGDPIPYNCQLVEARGDNVRFTSNQGTGETASFKLR